MATRSHLEISQAPSFARSPRGRFIIAQALYYGILRLSEVEGVMQEKSNIADMQYLLDTLYPGFADIFAHIEQQRITLLNGREV